RHGSTRRCSSPFAVAVPRRLAFGTGAVNDDVAAGLALVGAELAGSLREPSGPGQSIQRRGAVRVERRVEEHRDLRHEAGPSPTVQLRRMYEEWMTEIGVSREPCSDGEGPVCGRLVQDRAGFEEWQAALAVRLQHPRDIPMGADPDAR